MKPFGKNTVVGVSVGTLVSVVAFVWMASGLGRPVFASDLEKLDKKISVAVLDLARQNLQSELRGAKRELRQDPNNDDIEEDIDDIEDEIEEIDDKIECYRTKGCELEGEV